MTTTPETPATPAPAKKQAGTEYIVLATYIGNTNWRQLGAANGTSADNAIKHWYSRYGETIVEPSELPTQLVAIPARSWRPVKVTVQQVSKVTLEDA